MTHSLTHVARTISEELSRSVEAAELAQNAGLEEIAAHIRNAIKTHSHAIEAATEMEREAARLVSEALKTREAAQKDLYEAMGGTHEKLRQLRTDKTADLSGGSNVRQLHGTD